MEQASRRSSSHEGGLLLDPLHKGISFPLMPKDREDRQHSIPAQHRSSVSGFPPPVVDPRLSAKALLSGDSPTFPVCHRL
jgi:hypothetical protein